MTENSKNPLNNAICGTDKKSNIHEFSNEDCNFLSILGAYKNNGLEQKLCLAHKRYYKSFTIWKHKMVQPSWLARKTNSKQDTYITPSFYKAVQDSNKAENISSVFAMVSDIELINHNELMSDELISDVVSFVQNWDFPFHPTFIVSSGRGVHLWYFFDRTLVATEQYLNLYSLTVKKLNEKTGELLADSFSDIFKIDNITANKKIRLPGTYNEAACRYSKVVWCNNNGSDCHNFFDYANYFKESKEKKKKPKTYSLSIATNSPYSRRINRIFNDFVTIAEYMDYNSITEGYRDNMLFSTALYYLISGLQEELIFSKLEYLNGCFPMPLPDIEIGRKYQAANKYLDGHKFGSFFATEQIIAFNSLTPLLADPDLDSKLRELCSAEQKALNKRARDLDSKNVAKWNRNRKTKKKERTASAKANRDAQIVALRGQGLTQIQIATKLSITRQTVAKVLKTASEDALLARPGSGSCPLPRPVASNKPVSGSFGSNGTEIPDTIKKRYEGYLNGSYSPRDIEHYRTDLKIFKTFGLDVEIPIKPVFPPPKT